MRRMIGGAGAYLATLVLTVSAVFGQQEAAFFRILSPTDTIITALGSDGTLGWTNASTAGVTCIVQRATTLVGPSNWVDYVQHEATNAAMALRLFDPNPPAGMALIPAGSFQMGDNLDGLSSAMPVHTVYVSAFYMDKTEVTMAKWREVRDWAVNNGYDLSWTGGYKADSHPVENVRWREAAKWCNARS